MLALQDYQTELSCYLVRTMCTLYMHALPFCADPLDMELMTRRQVLI